MAWSHGFPILTQKNQHDGEISGEAITSKRQEEISSMRLHTIKSGMIEHDEQGKNSSQVEVKSDP